MKNIKKIDYEDFIFASKSVSEEGVFIYPIPTAENLSVIVGKINEIIELINTCNK